jgi:hypothetical protein
LWEQENGDDSFSELNRVEPGMNSGWVQIMGPAERVAQFKAIETDPTAPQPFAPAGYFGLQQIRWPPTNIADTIRGARRRLEGKFGVRRTLVPPWSRAHFRSGISDWLWRTPRPRPADAGLSMTL